MSVLGFKDLLQFCNLPSAVINENPPPKDEVAALLPMFASRTRVAATQDLAALDIDLAAITQAGGWKCTRMPLQYAEKINAARSGMARAAAATGRDKPEGGDTGAEIGPS